MEREEQNKKSKVAEMWNGLHFFNLKSQSSQEHRKSYQVEAKSIPQTLLYISHSWLLRPDQNEENANTTQMVIGGGIPPDLVSLDVGEALGQFSSWLRVGITWEL